MWIRPRRNVPVVRTTAPAARPRPSASTTPATRPSVDARGRRASPSTIVEVRRRRELRLHGAGRRACDPPGRAARAPPGPCARFSSRNWMPAASATRPITPSSASISRTRWPLPSPPIAGLQRHRADGREAMRDERRPRAHARRSRSGLGAGVAAADHDHVEAVVHGKSGILGTDRRRGKRGQISHRPSHRTTGTAARRCFT